MPSAEKPIIWGRLGWYIFLKVGLCAPSYRFIREDCPLTSASLAPLHLVSTIHHRVVTFLSTAPPIHGFGSEAIACMGRGRVSGLSVFPGMIVPLRLVV